MEKKNVVVTGGAGFIGSFLCEQLLKLGHRVIAIDNFSSGHVRNIEPLLQHPDFVFLKFDITEPFDLGAMPELEHFKVKFLGVQEIYHLAAPTAVKQYEAQRLPAIRAHSRGVEHVCEYARAWNAKVLLASAATIYGPCAPGERVTESHLGAFDHLSPRGAFNEGRRFSETIVNTYRDIYGLDTKIARVFRVYGPRTALFRGHQVPDMILDVLDGRNITIMGDQGIQTSLLYVTDAVDGLIRLMAADRGLGPVNIGSGEAITLEDVASAVMKGANSTAQIRYEALPPHMILQGLPDITLAKERLGWVPLVRLEDGLARTIDYVRANKLLLTEGETGGYNG
jgi:UDP-glucuronate decarboxylase